MAVRESWWKGMINVQTAFALGGAIVSVCFFIFRTNLNDKDITQLKKDIIILNQTKSDKAELKATDDKVNRQYENNNKITDRIIVLEKAQEYERGFHDAEEKLQVKK